MIEKRDAVNLTAKALGFLINVIITFFLTSFIVENIGSEAYGFVGLANDFISYVQIFTIALNSMASRFITIEYQNNSFLNVKQYYSSLILMNILISCLLAIIGVILVFNIESVINVGNVQVLDIKLLWLFLLANFILSLIGTVFQVATFCKRRLELEATRTVIASILKAFILVVCYICFEPYIWYVGLATLLSGIYSLICNIKYTKQLMPGVEIRRKYFAVSKVLILVKSGFWNSLTQLGAVLLNGLDLVVTNLFVGNVAMGTMSISKTFPKYILNLFATMASAFTPGFVISVASNDKKKLCEQMASTIRILSLISSVPMVILFVCGKQLFELWVPTENANVLYNITIVSCVSYIVLLPLEPVWNVFTALNKLKVTSIYLLVESIISIMIELAILGIISSDNGKLYVIVGVGSMLILFRSLVFLPLYVSKCIGRSCSFIYGIILKNMVIVAVASAIGLAITNIIHINSWMALLGVTVMVGSITIVLCLIFVLTKQERKILLVKLRVIRKKG